jgi:hypothetical protein
MQFNHVANRIDARFFETVITMFQAKLDFVQLRRIDRAIWMRQPGTNVDLQLNRSETHERTEERKYTQVAFLSETPREALEDLAVWLGMHGIAASVGSYSDREFFLDAPDAFVDFVIEAMRPELAEYGVVV